MEGLCKDDLNELCIVVRQVIDLVSQLPEATGKHGGYFCRASTVTGFPHIVLLVGNVPQNKLEKYLTYAMEKARRLSLPIHAHHLTSRESRNPEKEEWGGAVWGCPYIYSFSGFPERLDEAAMIVVASKFSTLSDQNIRALAGMFGDDPNPFWPFIEKHARFS